jgi:hypothetical protein
MQESRQLYAIDQAAWVWHPGVRADGPAVVAFQCEFEATDQPLRLHVSADQRFELHLDGQCAANTGRCSTSADGPRIGVHHS